MPIGVGVSEFSKKSCHLSSCANFRRTAWLKRTYENMSMVNGNKPDPETRPAEFVNRDPSVTGRGSFRKKGAPAVFPTYTIGENNLADLDDPDIQEIRTTLRRRLVCSSETLD
eukprot:sb/3476985/